MKTIFRKILNLFKLITKLVKRKSHSVSVTTEDTNHDGSIDKVTVLVSDDTNLEKEGNDNNG